MKKTLIALIIALFAITAQAQRITTNGSIILETGSISKHDTPDIYVGFTYSAFQTSYIANLTLTKPGAGAGAIYAEFQIRYTKAEIDAFTGSGTGDTEKVQDAVMQAVAATLLALNPAITFTIV